MLEGIDDIEWSNLKHAYEAADDVPLQIRGLLEPEKKSLSALYGNIWHQGTRYEATIYAIPFLLELINDENTPQREEIIYFLIMIALGSADIYLIDGIDVDELENEIEIRSKYGYGIQAEINFRCYNEVKKGVSIFLNLLHNSNVVIRKAAIYALAWFPEYAEKSISSILHILPEIEEENEIVTAILSIGFLKKNSKVVLEIPELESYLDSDSVFIKTATSIIFANDDLSIELTENLIEGMLHDFPMYIDGLPFYEGDFTG